MYMENSDMEEWSIGCCSPDEAGLEFYLKEYKPFRLHALKQDPEAFGSTYANEMARTDEDWRKRLYNPIAKTFVAVRPLDRRILCSTSLFGPMPEAECVPNPGSVASRADTTNKTHSPWLYQLTGVYTCSEARGRGLGQATVKVAIESAHEEARRQGKECRVAVDVYATNTKAISFYEKCGFVVSGPRPGDSDTEAARAELLMHYRDSSASSQNRETSALRLDAA